MSNIIHPNEVVKPEPEIEPRPTPLQPEEEDPGNPNHLKCPKCGDTPLHYELHVKNCKGKRKR